MVKRQIEGGFLVADKRFRVINFPQPDESGDAEEIQSFEDALYAALEACAAVMIERQRKYGSNNINAGGIPGVMVRMQDKVARAWHMLGVDALATHGNIWDAADNTPVPPDAGDESLVDSFVDMVNYGLIALMLHEGIWGLPFEEELDDPNE